MIVYLVRHGAAVDVGEHGVERDGDRMLSEEGKRKTGRAAAGLRAVSCRPERVFTSPLIRARETADIVAQALDGKPRVGTLDLLAPGADLDALPAWLRRQTAESLMLVGHMPSLAELASVLLSGGDDCDILLKKASACCLSFDGRASAGTARLEWLIQPKALALLGDAN
ncbi:phosphohistidine phosphatase SixA [Verrucomicrobiota bacterium]